MSHHWLSLRKTRGCTIIRTIDLSDLHDALRLGWEDFKAVPSHAIILCVIYPVLGLVLARTVLGYSVLPLLFPLAAGFALLGPFAALGLYELSRRRELGEEASRMGCGRGAALALVRRHAGARRAAAGAVRDLGGHRAGDLRGGVRLCAGGRDSDFVDRVLTTSQGWWLIVVGCGVGFLFAVVALCISVVSFPLDARSSRRRRRSDGDVVARRRTKPGTDGGMGIDRRGAAGAGVVAAVPRPCRGHPIARPRHLASLPQGDRAGSQSAADPSPPARERRSAVDFPANLFPWRRKDGG